MDLVAPPNEVEIIGKHWRLELVEPNLETGKLGEMRQGECRMKVVIGQDPQQERDTVLHEIIHCIFSEIGYSPNEEVIQSLTSVLYGVLLKNPQLIAYLTLKEE